LPRNLEYGGLTPFSTASVLYLPRRLVLTPSAPRDGRHPEARDEYSGRSGTLAVENGVKPPYSTWPQGFLRSIEWELVPQMLL